MGLSTSTRRASRPTPTTARRPLRDNATAPAAPQYPSFDHHPRKSNDPSIREKTAGSYRANPGDNSTDGGHACSALALSHYGTPHEFQLLRGALSSLLPVRANLAFANCRASAPPEEVSAVLVDIRSTHTGSQPDIQAVAASNRLLPVAEHGFEPAICATVRSFATAARPWKTPLRTSRTSRPAPHRPGWHPGRASHQRLSRRQFRQSSHHTHGPRGYSPRAASSPARWPAATIKTPPGLSPRLSRHSLQCDQLLGDLRS